MGGSHADEQSNVREKGSNEVPASPSTPRSPSSSAAAAPSLAAISLSPPTTSRSTRQRIGYAFSRSRNLNVMVKSRRLKSGASLSIAPPSPTPAFLATSMEVVPSFANKYVSNKIVSIAANFWNSKVNSLPFADQMEVGVTLFLDMIVKDKSLKTLLKRKCDANDQLTIETMALKFLNSMGWLIRIMCSENENMEATLKTMGAIHKSMGIRSEHFTQMIKSFHETLAHYFTHDYGIKEKYAVDYIFTLASKLMMGDSMPPQSGAGDTEYLDSLEKCLRSVVGREYLFRHLQQMWCDEIVIYLQNVRKFKQQTSNKGRFMIARNIVDVSIHPRSDLVVNISCECRKNALLLMEDYEQQFRLKEDITVSADLFHKVTEEIYDLILTNHWTTFIKNIKDVQM